MVKKSIVKNVQSNGTWKNKENKLFYKYEIEMANGDIGEYSSISENQVKFVEGIEVEYNFTAGEFPKIKPSYNYTDNYTYNVKGNTDAQIARSVGIKSAIEYGVANNLDLNQILQTAKILSDFIIKEN
tara:strand:- start:1246 stop:1629 length:384 start_codon:yes stop_codon:yes gene_type:complete